MRTRNTEVEAVIIQSERDLLRYLGRILDGSVAPADSKQDVRQEATIQLLKYSKPLPATEEGKRKLLFRIARNLALTLLRKYGRKLNGAVSIEAMSVAHKESTEIRDSQALIDEELVADERWVDTKRRAKKVREALTSREFNIVKMRTKFTFPEIASRTGLTDDAARMVFNRAREKARRALEESSPERKSNSSVPRRKDCA